MDNFDPTNIKADFVYSWEYGEIQFKPALSYQGKEVLFEGKTMQSSHDTEEAALLLAQGYKVLIITSAFSKTLDKKVNIYHKNDQKNWVIEKVLMHPMNKITFDGFVNSYRHYFLYPSASLDNPGFNPRSDGDIINELLTISKELVHEGVFSIDFDNKVYIGQSSMDKLFDAKANICPVFKKNENQT